MVDRPSVVVLLAALHCTSGLSILPPPLHAPALTPPRLRTTISCVAAPEEKDTAEERSGAEARPAARGVGAWARENLLQGVEPSPDTYTIMAVYFVQGVLGLASLARTFYFKDALHLSPAEVGALSGVFVIPWTIKPLYGFLSDTVPLFGYRRKSYLLLAGLMGSGSWFALSTGVDTVQTAIFFSLLASASVAVSDVVVDSLVVERARQSSEGGDGSSGGGALQSLCWSCQAVGGLVSAYASGYLLDMMGAKQVFGITAVFPLIVVIAAAQLVEERKPNILADGPSTLFDAATNQTELLWSAVSQKSVWLPAAFIVFWQATPSCETAFFYFMTTAPDQGGLGLGPETLGRVKVGSSIASLAGTVAYRRWLKDVPIRNVLFWLSLVSAPLGLTQLAPVLGLTQQWGLPNEWFIFGDSVVMTVLGQLAFMPLLVLAASLCPPGVEGVLFATLMSLFNGAGAVGSEIGAALTAFFNVSEKDFSNLASLLVVCNLSSLLPLLAIGWLDAADDAGPGDGGGGGGGETASANREAKADTEVQAEARRK
jgi:folate/biopterin transporter